MRVLVLTSTFPGARGDGTPAFVADLAVELSDRFRVTVLAPRVEGAPPRESWDEVEVVRFPYFPRPWEGLAGEAIMPALHRSPWRVVEAPGLVRNMRRWAERIVRDDYVDLINAHWILPAGLAAANINRRFGVPYAVTVHGADAYALNGHTVNRVKKRVLDRASVVLPVSEDIAKTIKPLVSAHVPVQVVPMGSPSMSERVSSDRSKDTFVFVGRLAEKKGVDTALRALARLERGSLLILGSGPDRHRLERETRTLELEDRVEFMGKQPQSVVHEALDRALAIVMPSRMAADGDQDGTPVVLAEAFARGSPVVASEIAGIKEQVVPFETGVLVPPGDTQALADAMRWCLDNPDELKLMGATARTTFEGSPLDIRVTAERYVDVLEQVAYRAA